MPTELIKGPTCGFGLGLGGDHVACEAARGLNSLSVGPRNVYLAGCSYANGGSTPIAAKSMDRNYCIGDNRYLRSVTKVCGCVELLRTSYMQMFWSAPDLRCPGQQSKKLYPYPHIVQSTSSTISHHMNAIISSLHRALTLNVVAKQFFRNSCLSVCHGPVLPPRKSFSSQVVPDGRRFRMAVLGSGPAGFYTAYKVMSSIADAAVDMYERLPVPYGLVRYGVAPDHPEVKVSRCMCARQLKN